MRENKREQVRSKERICCLKAKSKERICFVSKHTLIKHNENSYLPKSSSVSFVNKPISVGIESVSSLFPVSLFPVTILRDKSERKKLKA